MKLIREADDFTWINESDEWDWVKEIPDTLNTYSRQYIDLDGLTPTERCQLQQLILDNGIYWSRNRAELIPEYCHSETVKAYSLHNGELYISTMGYEEFLKLLNKYEGQDSEALYTKGKDLLKGRINESDEWDWIDWAPSFDFRRGLYVIDLKTVAPKEKFEIQKQLLDMGVKWAGLETHPVKQYSDSEVRLYVIRDGRMMFSKRAEDIDAFMKQHFGKGMTYKKLTKENFI